MRIGIIGAMEVEVATLRQAMRVERVVTRAGMEFCEGALGGVEVVLVRCGVGKVSAAMCTQALVDLFDVTHVINTGVAGSLDASIDILDMVVSTDLVHHDVDATFFGYAPGEVPQLGVASFVADEGLRAAACAACGQVARQVRVHEGRIASGDQFVADQAVKTDIAGRFDAMCCEMEGASIAQTCWRNGIPFVVVRAISDKADGSAEMPYDEFEPKAAELCARVVECMVSNVGR